MTDVANPGVLTFGESLGLATSTTASSLLHDRLLQFSFGGAETNVAIGLRRLGVPVTWVSRLGDDIVGRLILRELAAEGVTARVTIDPEAPSGFMLKERRSGARTNVTYYRAGSAASKLVPSDLPADLVGAAAMLHVTGITPALSPSAHEAVLTAMTTAAKATTQVSLDINYRSRLWSRSDAAAALRALIPLADVVFASTEEAAMLVPLATSPSELARGLIDLGCSDAVIKRGAQGCTALIGSTEYSLSALQLSPIDTVGAGDGFVAGYLAELVSGEEPGRCLQTAVTTGGLACLSTGDWEGAPRRDELASLVPELVSR